MSAQSEEVRGFDTVAELNEAAKRLVERSLQVNLLALDARVQSKRGEGQLRGFDEVSSQMRMWSGDLHDKLKQLGELSSQIVSSSSHLTKDARRLRLLEEAARGADPGYVGTVLTDLRTRREQTQAGVARDWHAIRELLADLHQLGMMAVVLSRSAMIEATSAGPELRQHLDHVSREFYANSQAVVDILEALSKAIARS